MIYYDYREKLTEAGKTRIAVLEKMVPKERLVCDELPNDYRVMPYIILDDNECIVDIEVKQISDLIHSINSGRLQTQLNNSRNNEYSRPLKTESILIPEGLTNVTSKMKVLSGNYSYNVTYSQLWLQLLSQQRCGTMIIPSVHATLTGHIIAALDGYYSKSEHTSQQRRKYLDDSPELTQREASLTAIDGIGSEKAKSLISYFSCIGSVMKATQSELTRVMGIGPIQANRIRDFYWGVD